MKRIRLISAVMALIMTLSVLFVSCDDFVSLIETTTKPEDNITSEETSSDETSSDETGSDETGSDETGSDETGSNETGSDETGSDETGSNETGSDETGSTETSSEETTAEETETVELTYDGSEVTITFYHTMGMMLREVLDEYIYEFNKLYPNITVNHSQEGGYDDVRDKIRSELTVGNQPNIAYCYPDHIALYNIAGAVKTLDQFINSEATVKDAQGQETVFGLTDAQKTNFIDAFYEEGRQFGDGKMYSLPMSKSTELLYYNKTFFDAHNLTVPTTWDEMEEVMKQIRAIDPSCIPLGYDSESNWFINMCIQLGSPYTSAVDEHYLFDNATNRAFVKRFSEWHANGYVTTQEIYGSYVSALFTNTGADNTRCYMCISSSTGATHHRPAGYFEVGITTIPQADTDNRKVLMQGPSLCMFEGHSDQETAATWLFMKFLTTNPDFQAEFSLASGYMPIIKSAIQHPVYKEYLANADGIDNINAYAIKTALEQTNAYYSVPAFMGSAEARDEVGMLLHKCLTGYKNASDKDKLIADAFKEAIEECEYRYGSSTPGGELTVEQSLANATTYLKNMYSSLLLDKQTANDFEVVSLMNMENVTYSIEWSVDNDAVKVVKSDSRYVVIDVDDEPTAEIKYKLTATVCAPDGTRGEPIVFDLVIPNYLVTIPEALSLEDGTLVAINGTVTYINTPWDNGYGNMSVTISDDSGNKLYIYRLATKVELGDIIKVTGYMSSYNRTRQISQGATADIKGHEDIVVTYNKVTIPEANAAEDGTLVEVNGTVSMINTAWSDSYKNITVTIVDAEGNSLYIYRLGTNVTVGDVITVKGAVGSYNGTKQIAPGATATITGHDDSFT